MCPEKWLAAGGREQGGPVNELCLCPQQGRKPLKGFMMEVDVISFVF